LKDCSFEKSWAIRIQEICTPEDIWRLGLPGQEKNASSNITHEKVLQEKR